MPVIDAGPILPECRFEPIEIFFPGACNALLRERQV
jgi:hypothetical protein